MEKQIAIEREIQNTLNCVWLITLHWCCIEQRGKLFDCLATNGCKMLRSTLFHVHYIASRPGPAGSQRILLNQPRRLSIRMNILVVRMPILRRYGRDMVDNKINNTIRLNSDHSFLLCFQNMFNIRRSNIPNETECRQTAQRLFFLLEHKYVLHL